MRKGWEYKKLGEVCDVINGLWIGKKEPFINVAVIRNTNFSKDCQLNLDKVAFIDVEVKQFASKKLKFGDIIIEKSGGSEKQPVGRPILFNISDGNYSFSNFTSTLRIKDNTEVNSAYLHKCLYAFYLKGETIKLQSKTTGLHNLNIKGYLRLNIPLPPLSTQLAIVSELDKINELIRLKKEQLKDFDNLAQSLFYEMFGDPVENEKGWEVKKLGEISSLICNGNTPKGGSEVYVDNGILFLRSQNVWKNRLDLDDVAFIDEATHKSLKKSALNHNDLLITKTGRVNTENSSLGRTALFEGEDGSANINGHVYLVRLKEGMVHKYVLYILISNSYRELIRRTCVGGIDKRQLNKNHIEDLPIILPPLPLQRLFAQRIEQIEREKSDVQKSIQDLETLLASRMQYWFE